MSRYIGIIENIEEVEMFTKIFVKRMFKDNVSPKYKVEYDPRPYKIRLSVGLLKDGKVICGETDVVDFNCSTNELVSTLDALCKEANRLYISNVENTLRD